MTETTDSAERGPVENEPASAGTRHSRRSILLAGASGVSVAGLAVAGVSGKLPFQEPLRRTLGTASSSPATQLGSTKVERVHSVSRGREVDLVTISPTRSPAQGLPVVLLLHGLRGSARKAAPTGLLKQLSGEVARKALPPFAFVAVDGGDNYWHEHRDGDDPMTMLLEEVPQWLRARGLGGPDGIPFAVAGMSMGGFGALLYARRRRQRRQAISAVGAIAPALMPWPSMLKRRAFRDQLDWASMDPLRHVDALRGVPTGIWCGTEDPFIEGSRRYIAAAKPVVAHTARGKHGDSFNRTIVAGLVGFLGKHAPH